MHTPAALLSFDKLRHTDDWTRWSRLAADAPPFLSPEFFALVRGLGVTGEALVAEAWSPSAILGMLPLVLDDHTLRGLRGEHSPSYDFCGTPAGIEAIWNCLREDARWAELVLDKVPEHSLLATALVGLARRDGHHVVIRDDTHHPYFLLPGFEAALHAKFRSNLLRCERKAGGVTLERIAVPTHHDFTEAFAIEAKAWKGAGGTSIDSDARVAHVYEALGRLLGRRGRASLYFLSAGGKRIATLFAVEDDRTLYALKIGFDPTASNISPGHLLILEVARDAEQRGLRELNFVGHEDAWKRKWTDLVHELVAIRIYARTNRGRARYWLREVVKPRLPEPMRSTPRSPLPRSCQRTNVVGDHTLFERLRGRLDRGLGIKSGLRRAMSRRRVSAQVEPGEPSVFPVGGWVRVRDRAAIEQTLDGSDRTRGLAFVPVQWEECGKVLRVQRHVRRLRDDRGRFRTISRTVLLEGSDCNGHGDGPAGCGRHCPLMYRDEWLEVAHRPATLAVPAPRARHARVRDANEIVAGLDLRGQRDGVTFMTEMAAYAGRRFVIAGELDRVFEYDRWIEPPQPIYFLAGLHCSGDIARNSCDRACALMWHRDWLVLEPDATT